MVLFSKDTFNWSKVSKETWKEMFDYFHNNIKQQNCF